MRVGARLRPAVLSLLLVAALAGCGRIGPGVAVGPAEVMIPPLPDTCGAGMAGATLGQPFTGLADVALPGPLRVLWPAQEVTRDLHPTRLNARVSAEGRVQALFCG